MDESPTPTIEEMVALVVHKEGYGLSEEMVNRLRARLTVMNLFRLEGMYHACLPRTATPAPKT